MVGCDPDTFDSNTCIAQPGMKISNILFENITGINTQQTPGEFKCDPKNPCQNITFVNVQNHGNFTVSSNYMCENVYGSATNSNAFLPSCFKQVPGNTEIVTCNRFSIIISIFVLVFQRMFCN